MPLLAFPHLAHLPAYRYIHLCSLPFLGWFLPIPCLFFPLHTYLLPPAAPCTSLTSPSHYLCATCLPPYHLHTHPATTHLPCLTPSATPCLTVGTYCLPSLARHSVYLYTFASGMVTIFSLCRCFGSFAGVVVPMPRIPVTCHTLPPASAAISCHFSRLPCRTLGPHLLHTWTRGHTPFIRNPYDSFMDRTSVGFETDRSGFLFPVCLPVLFTTTLPPSPTCLPHACLATTPPTPCCPCLPMPLHPSCLPPTTCRLPCPPHLLHSYTQVYTLPALPPTCLHTHTTHLGFWTAHYTLCLHTVPHLFIPFSPHACLVRHLFTPDGMNPYLVTGFILEQWLVFHTVTFRLVFLRRAHLFCHGSPCHLAPAAAALPPWRQPATLPTHTYRTPSHPHHHTHTTPTLPDYSVVDVALPAATDRRNSITAGWRTLNCLTTLTTNDAAWGVAAATGNTTFGVTRADVDAYGPRYWFDMFRCRCVVTTCRSGVIYLTPTSIVLPALPDRRRSDHLNADRTGDLCCRRIPAT